MRALKVIGVGVMVSALLCVAGFLLLGIYLSPQDKLRQADIIVAISGGETDSRTAEAVRLYEAGYAPKLLFSGAAQDQNGPSNAAAMRSLAIKRGVPPGNIDVEENALNTLQNAYNSATLLHGEDVHTLILVTSPYHQRRASIEFQRALGKSISIINHSSPDQRWRRSHWWATQYSTDLTMAELKKTIYVLGTKDTTTPSANPAR